jgi:hypothetical protein
MSVVGSLTALVLWAAGASPEAIVAIGDATAAQSAVEAISRAHRQNGAAPLQPKEALAILTGISGAETPDQAALRRMLADGRELDARFETVQAGEIYQAVYDVYKRALWPDASLRSLAFQALVDMAAVLWAERKNEAAQGFAQQALTEFPEQAVDPHRHSPTMRQRFEHVLSTLTPVPQAAVSVTVDRAATVFVDGVAAADGVTTANLNLPVGVRRIWAADERGRSLPRRIQLDPAGATVSLEIGFGERLTFEPVMALRCARDCETDLRRVGVLLGVDRVVSVTRTPDGEHVSAIELREPVAKSDDLARPPAAGRAEFSWLWLVPLVGQWTQKRPVFALSYLAVEAGLWGFYVYASHAHAAAVEQADWNREPALRTQANTALALAVGAMAAGVVEALVVGWLRGAPQDARK